MKVNDAMKIFVYRDMQTKKEVFRCEATSILDADERYQKETGQNIVKQSHIGCSIKIAAELPK